MDIVLVTWVDSKMSDKSWEKKEEATHLTSETATTAGHLLEENENDIILAFCYSPTDVNGVIAIPKVSIKSIQKLTRL